LRRIDDVARLAKTRALPPDLFHDGLPNLQVHPEVTRPGHGFALKKIVGADRDTLEPIKEIPHGGKGVVNPPQENRLVGNGNPRLQEHFASPGGLRCDFSRMIELRVEPEGTMMLQNPAEGLGNPHGQNHRYPASDTEHFHVGNGAKGSSSVSSFRSLQIRGSPPEKITSRIFRFDETYSTI